MKKNVNSMKERLIEYIKHLGISIREFERSIGSANGYINGITKGISADRLLKINRLYPTLNTNWLLTGEGSMLNATPTPAHTTDSNPSLIPLINLDSVGGMNSSNLTIDTTQYIERLIPFENAQQGDIAIHQSGESMSPTIPAGSILQIRRIEAWREYIGYGDIYVIELTDGRRLTKELTRYDEDPNNYVLCISHNKNYPPEPLPRAMIKSMWKVIRILIELGW